MKTRISVKLVLQVIFYTVFVMFLLSAEALAQGIGTIEISQKNIPIKITKGGSYILTSNLAITNPNVTVISILADNVLIDLNGFNITGPGKDPGSPSFGINTSPTLNNNVVIRNGTVTKFAYGIHIPGKNNRVENVIVSECSHGIFGGMGSVVRNSQVFDCQNAIGTDGGSMVINNSVYSNYSGINTYGGAPDNGGVVVTGNNLRLNSGVGIRVRGQGCRIEANTITLSAIGIDLTDGSNNLFAKNFLQGNTTAMVGEGDDIGGGTLDAALQNIILLNE